MFYTGSDGAVYQAKLRPSPGRPVSLGGNVVGGPGPEFIPPGSLAPLTDLYVRGTDNELWLKQINPPSNWLNLGLGGFKLTSKPSATAGVLSVPGNEAEDIVARGADGAVWDQETNYHGVTPWVSRGWHSLGGAVTSGAGATSALGGSTWVTVLGSDNNVWTASGVWPALHGWSRASQVRARLVDRDHEHEEGKAVQAS
jgi:hypothetical protein